LGFVQFFGAQILAQEQFEHIENVQLRLGDVDVHILLEGDTADSMVTVSRYFKEAMPALANMQGLKKVVVVWKGQVAKAAWECFSLKLKGLVLEAMTHVGRIDAVEVCVFYKYVS
jgi:hypothetical protein